MSLLWITAACVSCYGSLTHHVIIILCPPFFSFYIGTMTADFTFLWHDILLIFVINHSAVQQTLSDISAFMSQSVFNFASQQRCSGCGTVTAVKIDPVSGNATRNGCRTLRLNAREITQILKSGNYTLLELTPC